MKPLQKTCATTTTVIEHGVHSFGSKSARSAWELLQTLTLRCLFREVSSGSGARSKLQPSITSLVCASKILNERVS
ncbi:hypothetical protein RJT34_07414 [Clitoria ternatea]|uniref:Uncharacterized protein n=1 Tax=Clitoria ternatea TaxID=43366 RepID=A0AAN9K3E2_CLITE